MLIYLLLITVFSAELYRNVYPDSYETMSNAIIIKYNSLKLKAEKNQMLQEKVITISYNCIYFYSLCQIQYNKINSCIKSFIKAFIKAFIKNNNEIAVFQEMKCLSILIEDDSTHLIKMTKTFDINTVFYESFPETFDYKESSIKFMSIELQHENNTHLISLKNESYNYYIVGNSLNQNFFKYYLKNVLKADINKDNFNYKVSIIDHNVNFITLLSHQSLIIGENDYYIVNPDTTNNNVTNNDTANNDTANNDTANNDTANNTVTNSEDTSDSDKSDDFVKLDAAYLIYA